MILNILKFQTRNFTSISRKAAEPVFDCLVTVGDLTTGAPSSSQSQDVAAAAAAAAEFELFPTPPPLLVAYAYAETSLSFLRTTPPDVAGFKSAIDVYNVAGLKEASSW